MKQNETGGQTPKEPILCANSCGFFGVSATRNLCSKCYEEWIMVEETEKILLASIAYILNDNPSTSVKESEALPGVDDLQSGSLEVKLLPLPAYSVPSPLNEPENTEKGPNRCNIWNKRVGLLVLIVGAGTLCALLIAALTSMIA